MTKEENKEILKLYRRVLKVPYKRHGFTWYEVQFRSQAELYQYLSSNPKINRKIFSDPYSLKRDDFFGNVSLEKANEFLLGGYNVNLDKMFELARKIEIDTSDVKRKVVKSVTGSRVSVNSLITGSDKKFYRLERASERKFLTINLNLVFDFSTTESQVLNRGALVYNLIDVLERNDYSVDLNAFLIMRNEDEIIYIKVNLKDLNSSIRMKEIIYPLTSYMFLRKNIFRVMESLQVKSDWGSNYGFSINRDTVLNLLGLNKFDIYIDAPNYMGILGEDLKDDTSAFLDYVDIKKYVKTL